MRSAASIFALVLLLAVMVIKVTGSAKGNADDYVRDRTVILHGNGRMCTGTMIISPYNFKPYILTAAHCASELSPQGTVAANQENGTGAFLKIIKIDPDADLMLLSTAWTTGLFIGKPPLVHAPVRAITWGAGEPPHLATGEVLETNMEFNELGAHTFRMLTTAHIDHGSSGGPVVNASNELIGIVCVGYGETLFSNEAPVTVIMRFLADVKD